MVMKRISALVCILMLLCLLSTACNSNSLSNNKDIGFKEEYGDGIPTDTAKAPNSNNKDKNIKNDLDTRKLIKDVTLDIETRSFDDFMTKLQGEINMHGGFVQKSEINGRSYSDDSFRYATIEVRIPAKKLDDFTGKVSSIGNVTGKSEGTQDVTMDYVDIQSQIKALKTEQESLLKLLEKADNLNDILTIQSHLTDVRYELESYESRLRTYDDLIDYSTVRMSISEVERETPTKKLDMWQEIGTNLSNNLHAIGMACCGLFIWFVSASPYLLIMAIIAVAVILIIRYSNKKKRKIHPPVIRQDGENPHQDSLRS